MICIDICINYITTSSILIQYEYLVGYIIYLPSLFSIFLFSSLNHSVQFHLIANRLYPMPSLLKNYSNYTNCHSCCPTDHSFGRGNSIHRCRDRRLDPEHHQGILPGLHHAHHCPSYQHRDARRSYSGHGQWRGNRATQIRKDKVCVILNLNLH